MKVYIASHCQKSASECAAACRERGHEIVASWISKEFKRTAQFDESERGEIAATDVEDVASCDVLILQSCVEKVAGGKFVELGVALGLGKLIAIIGFRENMLCWHPSIVCRSDIDGVLEWLQTVEMAENEHMLGG